uniref:Uncharacterized protein n=1 Tax=Opuntia streptacantha TaxID=393608 RepID=A0A7C8Z7E9_OPUST
MIFRGDRREDRIYFLYIIKIIWRLQNRCNKRQCSRINRFIVQLLLMFFFGRCDQDIGSFINELIPVTYFLVLLHLNSLFAHVIFKRTFCFLSNTLNELCRGHLCANHIRLCFWLHRIRE